MKLKKLEIKKYQLFSIAFFGAFLIGLIFPWFNALDIKIVPGTLILSALFPFGIIAVFAYIALNLITVIFKNNVYIHIANLYPIIVLALLTLRLVGKYDEFSLSYGFYISIISLALTFIFSVANIICFKKESNVSITLTQKM